MTKRSVGIQWLTLITLITFSSVVQSVNRVRRQTTDSSVRRGGDSSLHSSRPLNEGPSSADSELGPFDPDILEGDAMSTGRHITFERKEVPHDFHRSASEEGQWRWTESPEATHHSQSWTLHNNEGDITSELEMPEINTGEVNYSNRKPAEESLEDSLTHPEEAVHVMESFPVPNLDIMEEVLFTSSDPEINSALNTPDISVVSNEETPSQETTSFEKELLTKSNSPSSIEDFSVGPTQTKIASSTSINNVKHFNPTLIVSFSHINTTESSSPMLSSSINSIPEHKEQTTRFTLHTRKPNNITNNPVTVPIPKIDNSTSANRHSKFILPSYPKDTFHGVQSNNETKSELLNTTVSNKKTNLSNPAKELSSNVLSTVASSSYEDFTLTFQTKIPFVTIHKSFQQPTSSTSHSAPDIISTELLKPIRNSSNNWDNTSIDTKSPKFSTTQDILTDTVKIISNHSVDNKKLSVFPSFSEAVNRTTFQKVQSSTQNSFLEISDTTPPIIQQTTRKTVSSVDPKTTNATPSLVTEFTTVYTQLTESPPTISAEITQQSTTINSTSKRTHFNILETSSLPTNPTSLSELASTSQKPTVLTSQSIITASTVFLPTAPTVLTESSTVEKFSIPTVPSVFIDTTLLRTIHRKRLPDQMLTTPIRPTVRSSEETLPPLLFSTQSTEQSNHQINHNSIIPSKDSTEATEDIVYEENSQDSQLITASTTHTIIISSVIGGCAILFFAFLMIFCMWKQRVNRRARFRQPELGIINQLNGKH